MKARVNDQVKTLEDVRDEFTERVVPRGTIGTVVERYRKPEGYAIDLAVRDDALVGGATYVHVVLEPDQFEVLEPALAAPGGRRHAD